ncbi:IS66 family transposase [Hephaestia sp. GCM10023244]|uniref:IS66 family transposase n=2 Tax=unclassified Hephaestia TaxID=2631281 RepID=UPI003A90288F
MSDETVSPPDRDARIASLQAQIDARDRVITMLRAQLARLRRMTFGTSSEKLAREIEQLELALEEYEAEAASADARAPDIVAKPERPAPVRSLPPHLPRDEVIYEPTTGTCACPSCGGALRRLGADADEMLDVVPISWRVVRHIRPKYSCRACEAIVQAPAPPKPCPRGKATFGTLAHVIVAKFDHHLPLYRQAEMMAAQGVEIDRSTLAGWTGQAAHLLDPIVKRIREEGLKATKIHADDTPVKVLAPGSGKTATGRLWTYVVDDRASGAATPPLVWYRFTANRAGIHPKRELATFAGFLQADAYAGFNGIYAGNRVSEVACWAHFRRELFERHKQQPTALTTDLLDRIGQLYAIEAEIRGQPADVRRSTRQARSQPLVTALRVVLDDALRKLAPKSPTTKAIRYGTKRWDAFTRFLDDGRLEIDNNIAERAIRPIAIGRKNWLFAGSQAGGERAAAIYSVIETAKINGLEPQAYIADVISKIAADWPATRWDELLPWNWQPPVDQPIAQAA